MKAGNPSDSHDREDGVATNTLRLFPAHHHGTIQKDSDLQLVESSISVGMQALFGGQQVRLIA